MPDSLQNLIRPVAETYANLLREVLDYGLIYWEPKGSLEESAKADMVRRIESALSHSNGVRQSDG